MTAHRKISQLKGKKIPPEVRKAGATAMAKAMTSRVRPSQAQKASNNTKNKKF